MRIHLGQEQADPPAALAVPAAALLRHMMALGSSGSGKTVLCKVVVEEAVRCGIPVICVDPQGDLCSLAIMDQAAGGAPAADPAAAREYADRADVVVFTPASQKGIALCADPLDGPLDDLAADDKVQALSRAASMIVALLGYDLDSDEGAGLRAVLDTALGHMEERGRPAGCLGDVAAYLNELGDADIEHYGRFLDARKIRTACQRLARLDVGARRLLFHEGLPLDIDMLLGRGPRGAALPGKTRVSVIYLNTLHSQEDKDFFVAALVERLYAWMLRNPSATPQALLYIDEIAPFVPPVRKPSCKPGLELLFRQARKYGVCCLMATQNPGDVDYKAMAQFGTWALGRLTTRQDMKKVEPIVKSMAPADTDAIMAALPARRPGEFTLLSPDSFDGVRVLAARWPCSAHETLDEARIEALCDARWRHRFGAGERANERASAPVHEDGPEPVRAPDPAPAVIATVTAARPDPRADALERMARTLGERRSMSARELAERAGLSEGRARSVLKALVERGVARRYQDGRAARFYALSTGARPDLDLGPRVAVVRPAVDEARVRQIARTRMRSRLLWLIGEAEHMDSVRLLYRPVYQVAFEEEVARTGIKRLLGSTRDQLVGTVYHHPHTLQILVFSPRRGIEFADQPAPHASRVDDFDGVATFDDVPPTSIDIDEEAWRARKPPDKVKKHFRSRFDAIPRTVTPVFVPLWKVMLLQRERGNYRVLWLDGLVGRHVTWPAG